MVALRYSIAINGFSGLILNKIDVLTGLEKLRVCTGYRIDGRMTDQFPSSVTALEGASAVYEDLPGWDQDISKARPLASQ